MGPVPPGPGWRSGGSFRPGARPGGGEGRHSPCLSAPIAHLEGQGRAGCQEMERPCFSRRARSVDTKVVVVIAENGFHGDGARRQQPAGVANLSRRGGIREVPLRHQQLGAPGRRFFDRGAQRSDGVSAVRPRFVRAFMGIVADNGVADNGVADNGVADNGVVAVGVVAVMPLVVALVERPVVAEGPFLGVVGSSSGRRRPVPRCECR